ncbi:hypothetical protein BESB_014030 [Besnoitia besnoiti]|uniref:Uncharacterized protein n=1 Tax=Besnoitia besnoiti TaxID=94643 RepID=A0A2A9M8Z2_BESBE|nr:hypothetical protein BESB_014030 [Besnoitia besnoiti]PFH32791.1 hypothetical protein BESB_014030 [Besnoitia besnoiti]
MTGKNAVLLAVLLSLVVVSASAQAEDKQGPKVQATRQHIDETMDAQTDAVTPPYDALEEFIQAFREVKKAVEQDVAVNKEAMQRVADFDLVSLLDVIREAAQAKFTLLGRLIGDIASGIGNGALALMGDEAAFIQPKKQGLKRTTTTTSTTPTTTTSTTSTTTTSTSTTSTTSTTTSTTTTTTTSSSTTTTTAG